MILTFAFALSVIALALCCLPAIMFLVNLPQFRWNSIESPYRDASGSKNSPAMSPPVSVLVPARDEAEGISECIAACLAASEGDLEVVVLDDHSTDATAKLVTQWIDQDSRVRLISGKRLPSGWNGKQHACWQLAAAATYDHLLFIDADVRLKPGSLTCLTLQMKESNVGLLSAFPHQVTGSWMEAWLIPMMHFILLCYLPFSRMRTHSDPSLAAGCGQLFLTTSAAYRSAGTHEAIKQSRHDGVKLPRAYRNAGLMTDVVDGTSLADCRMYSGAVETIRGALKNAIEGIANPRLIVVFTILLLGCSLLPVVALGVSVATGNPLAIALSTIALVVSHLPRVMAASYFQQSLLGAICHIPATICFVALQWVALLNHFTGRQIAWRGRLES